MRRLHVDDLVYQVATLVLSFLIVHVPYTLVVRPERPGRARGAGPADGPEPRVRPGALLVGDHQGPRAGVGVHPVPLGALHHGRQVALELARAGPPRARPRADRPGGAHPPRGRPRVRAADPGPPGRGEAAAPPAHRSRRPQPLPRHPEHPGRRLDRARGLLGGVGPARLRARHDPLHRLGHPLDRVHRHRARHRRRPHHGPPRRAGRHLRGHRGARRRLQLHVRGAPPEPAA